MTGATQERITPTVASPIRSAALILEQLTMNPERDPVIWAEPIARESAAASERVADMHENNERLVGEAEPPANEARALLAGINATALIVASEGSPWRDEMEAGEDEWVQGVQYLAIRLSRVADALAGGEADHG